MTMTLPYDLHEKAREVAERKGIPVEELMRGSVREALRRESFVANE